MDIARLRRVVARGRRISVALAIALVAAQGASLAHFALVRHAICPLHGDLIHLDEGRHEARVGNAINAAVPGLYGSKESDQDRDEHCSVVGVRREVALPAGSGAVLAEDVRPAGEALTAAWVPVSETRFRIAPKQSPPV